MGRNKVEELEKELSDLHKRIAELEESLSGRNSFERTVSGSEEPYRNLAENDYDVLSHIRPGHYSENGCLQEQDLKNRCTVIPDEGEES